MNAVQREVEITNKRGLHARASAKFVNMATGLAAKIEVEKDGNRVGGTSIMGLMMLGAAMGDRSPSTATATAATRRWRSWRRWSKAASARIDASPDHLLFQRDGEAAARAARQEGAARRKGCSSPRACGSSPRRATAAACRRSSPSRPPAVHPLAAEIIAAAEAAGGEVIETTPDILSKMSGKDNPQMLLGAYRQPDTSLAAIDRSASPLWIVAQALRDPGNIGTILRTGDATGAGGLILIDDSADPFSVEAVRASMGAIFTQAVATARWEEFLAWLRSGPGQLVGTSLKTDTRLSRRRL